VRQYRHAVGSDLWEIPAGKLEPGEDPLACARRELQEETGYAAEVWTRLLSFYTSPGFSDERIVLFRASRLRPVGTVDRGEIAERCARSIGEIERMIRASQITDAKTILAVSWLFGRTKETPDARPTAAP
jgi:ADP-ribose pyrophosphatase